MSDQDKEVHILIKAKNLTAEEFAKAREQIAGLSKSVTEGNQKTKSSFDTLKHQLTGMWEDPLASAKKFGQDFVGTSVKSAGASSLAYLGFAAAVGGAIYKLNELALEAIAVAAELDDMSEITATSVVELSALKFAGQAAGVPLEKLTNYMFALQQRMQESPKQFGEGLEKIGLSMERVRDLKGDQLLLTIARAFRENTDEANRAGTAVDLFGKQGRDAIPLLMEPLDELVTKAKELGLVMTDEDAAAAEDFERSLNSLKAQAAGTWTQLGLHVSVAANVSYAYERMKLAVANVALTFADFIGTLKETVDIHLQLLGLMDITAGKMPKVTSGGAEEGGAEATLNRLKQQVASLKAQMPIFDSSRERLEIKHMDDALREKDERRKAALKAETEATKNASEDYHQQIVQEIADMNLLHQAAMQARVDPIREAQAALKAGIGVKDSGQGLGMQGLAPNAGKLAASLAGTFRTPLLSGFKNIFEQDVPTQIINAIAGGGSPMGAAAATLGHHLGQNISERLGQHLASSNTGLSKAVGSQLKASMPALGAMAGNLVGQGLSAIGDKLGGYGTALGGAAKGAQIGMMAGPIGAAVGAGIGAIVGAFGGQREEKKVNNMRDEFIAAAGGLEALNKQAHDAGTSLDKLLHAKKVKDFESAINDLNGKMGNFAQDQAQDQQDLNDAVQRYGFSLEELGPKLRKQKLDEQAAMLMNDFRLLAGSGIDVGLVLDKMGGSINDFVGNALRTGTEVPASMKPMLERMVEMGTLTDENGNKITSLDSSGLTFSESMTQGFDKVVKKFDELLTGLGLMPAVVATGVGSAVNDLGKFKGSIEEVTQTVDELNFGSSPGGLKEIALMLDRGSSAAERFKDTFIGEITEAGSQVDTFTGKLKQIGDVDVNLNANWNIPPLPVPNDTEVPGAAAGGIFTKATFRVIAEREPEIVGSPNVIVNALTQALERTGGRGPVSRDPGMLDRLTNKLDQLRQEMRAQRQMLPTALLRAVRDGGMV